MINSRFSGTQGVNVAWIDLVLGVLVVETLLLQEKGQVIYLLLQLGNQPIPGEVRYTPWGYIKSCAQVHPLY